GLSGVVVNVGIEEYGHFAGSAIPYFLAGAISVAGKDALLNKIDEQPSRAYRLVLYELTVCWNKYRKVTFDTWEGYVTSFPHKGRVVERFVYNRLREIVKSVPNLPLFLHV